MLLCAPRVLRANWWVSLPIILLLCVTRESTVILVAVLVAITVFRRQWAFRLRRLPVALVVTSFEFVHCGTMPSYPISMGHPLLFGTF